MSCRMLRLALSTFTHHFSCLQPASNGYAYGSSSYGRSGGDSGGSRFDRAGGGGGSSYGAGGGGGGGSRPTHGSNGGGAPSSFYATANASDEGDPYRQRKGIAVAGRSVPPPIESFESAGFTREMLDEVRNRFSNFEDLLLTCIVRSQPASSCSVC